jgi:hypothetical protein
LSDQKIGRHFSFSFYERDAQRGNRFLRRRYAIRDSMGHSLTRTPSLVSGRSLRLAALHELAEIFARECGHAEFRQSVERCHCPGASKHSHDGTNGTSISQA